MVVCHVLIKTALKLRSLFDCKVLSVIWLFSLYIHILKGIDVILIERKSALQIVVKGMLLGLEIFSILLLNIFILLVLGRLHFFQAQIH